jgi:hypothetical protein
MKSAKFTRFGPVLGGIFFLFLFGVIVVLMFDLFIKIISPALSNISRAFSNLEIAMSGMGLNDNVMGLAYLVVIGIIIVAVFKLIMNRNNRNGDGS